MGSIRRDQLPTAAIFVVGAIVLIALTVTGGSNPFMFISVAIFAGLALWSWPGRVGRHVSHADAQAAAGDDDVIVYWRPG